MPEVSVIMPAFNAAAYIRESCESVIAQSFTDWELLVTDDGSSDETGRLVTGFAESDGRIRLLKNECGSGSAMARNNSIRYASGTFIAFLDADDLWRSDKLEKQLAFMKTQNADFSYTGYNHISADGEFLKVIKVPESVDHDTLLKSNVIATATVMIRRDAFADLDMPDFPRAQDFALWLKLLLQTECAFGIQEPLSDYRITPNAGNRHKIFALKYLFDVYTRQEGKNPLEALGLIVLMFCRRIAKYW